MRDRSALETILYLESPNSYCDKDILANTDRKKWGSVIPQMAVPVPSISCCVLIHHNLFYQIQNALAFNRDTCCHLALCLRLLPFHCENSLRIPTMSNITLFAVAIYECPKQARAFYKSHTFDQVLVVWARLELTRVYHLQGRIVIKLFTSVLCEFS